MKVLMITPKIDEQDTVFGFTKNWVNSLAKKVDWLYVITQDYNMETELMGNVTVYSLKDKPDKLLKFLYFNRIIIGLSKEVDVIFCHMLPIFTFMSAPPGKVFNIPIVTWYAHGHVDCRVKLLDRLADRVVTSSEKGYRVPSKKKVVTGQGIDTELFNPGNGGKTKENIILSVGRISPVKDYGTLIKATNILVKEKCRRDLKVIIAGGTPEGSEDYLESLKSMVRELNLEKIVTFAGPIAHRDVIGFYRNCRVFVNSSSTGSLDKAVLEAMSCSRPILTCNQAFLDILDEKLKEKCFFRENDYIGLADKIEYFLENEDDTGASLRNIVVKHHSLDCLTDSFVRVFKMVIKDGR